MPEMERSSLLNGSFPTDEFCSPIKRRLENLKLIYIIPKFTRWLLKKSKTRPELSKKSFRVRRNRKGTEP
jgi:hypothetical protein